MRIPIILIVIGFVAGFFVHSKSGLLFRYDGGSKEHVSLYIAQEQEETRRHIDDNVTRVELQQLHYDRVQKQQKQTYVILVWFLICALALIVLAWLVWRPLLLHAQGGQNQEKNHDA